MVKKSAEMDPLNLSSVVVTGEDYPSDYFDDSEYGLLNAALVVQQNWNSSEGIKQT